MSLSAHYCCEKCGLKISDPYQKCICGYQKIKPNINPDLSLEKISKDIEIKELNDKIKKLEERMKILARIKNSVSNWDYYSTKEACEHIMNKKQKYIIELDEWEGENYDFAKEYLQKEHEDQINEIKKDKK